MGEEGDPPPGEGGSPVPIGGIAFQLSQLGSTISAEFQLRLAPLGIEPRQFAMLRYVENAEGRSQQALAEALEIPPSRMVALIDDMEARLLLERRPNPGDRRARAIYLTAAGRTVLGQAMAVAQAQEEAVCSALDCEEQARLPDLLRRIVDHQGLVTGVHPALTRVDPCR